MVRAYPPGAASTLTPSFLRGRSRGFSPLSVAPMPSAAAVPFDPPAGSPPDAGSVEMVDVSPVVISSFVDSPDVTPDSACSPLLLSLGAAATRSAGGGGSAVRGISRPVSIITLYLVTKGTRAPISKEVDP